MIKITHLTTVHPRDDVRIRYKYVQTLSEDSNINVELVVADGKGFQQAENYNIQDLGTSGLGRLSRFLIGNYKIFKFSLTNKSRIFHFHDPELLPVIGLLKLMGRRVIFDMHENLPLQILKKDYIPSFLRIILSKIINFFQVIALYFIPVVFAEFSYKKYFSRVKNKVVILNYPKKELISKIKANKRKEFTLGYMGSISQERGATIMLNTVDKLRSKGSHIINILFVGEVHGQLANTPIYKKAVGQGWAEFTGRLQPKQGWSLMAQCHVGMAVLQDSPNFIESYPTKLFEYMLLKLPIITSNFPLYAEIIQESQCGILVDPSSENEVSNAILKIMNNIEESKKMGERGFYSANDKYNWESEYNKLLSFYDQVLGLIH